MKPKHDLHGFVTTINRLDGARINRDISEWDEGILIKNFDKLLDEQVSVNAIGERIGVYYACKTCEFKHKEIKTAAHHICQSHMRRLYEMEKKKIHESLSQNWNVSFNKPIGCPFCYKIFYQEFGQAGLYQHIWHIHKEIACNQCNLSFARRDEIYFLAHYLEHYRAGSNDALSLTAKLYKFFKEKTIFDEIQNLYSCLICGQRSKRYTDLDQTYEHIRTHICSVYEFFMLKQQKVRSTAKRENDFECSRCPKRFNTQLGVRAHKRNAHNIIYVNVKGETPRVVTSYSDRNNI